MKHDIAVIGSSNIDLIMKMKRLPEKGETVTNADFMQTFGGKGANQAVAAARAGSRVLFVNAVGDDAYSETMLANFAQDGIDLTHILHCKGLPSGHALVMIGESGMNYLSVAPGANALLTPEVIKDRLEAIRAVPIWVIQCEIPEESLRYLLTEAKTEANRILWNFAPAIEMENPPLAQCDILVVNEVEAFQLSGEKVGNVDDALKAANALRAKGVTEVVLTLGAEGAVYVGPDGHEHIPGYSVKVEDTTAAGDTFCGALACALAEGRPWKEVLGFANAAAALSVTKLGAQASVPRREAIETFLQTR